MEGVRVVCSLWDEGFLICFGEFGNFPNKGKKAFKEFEYEKMYISF